MVNSLSLSLLQLCKERRNKSCCGRKFEIPKGSGIRSVKSIEGEIKRFDFLIHGNGIVGGSVIQHSRTSEFTIVGGGGRRRSMHALWGMFSRLLAYLSIVHQLQEIRKSRMHIKLERKKQESCDFNILNVIAGEDVGVQNQEEEIAAPQDANNPKQ
ncbi:hypothetical protein V6N13_133199 [Hibiscus sabdariffa]